MTRFIVTAFGLMAGLNLAAPMPAAAQSCADLGPAGTFASALAETNAEVATSAAEAFCAQIAELRDRAARAEAAMPPPGSILLVDDGRGCPQGWTDVALAEPETFAGRVPLAAGFAQERVFRSFREIGGSETVPLEVANLPPHAHGLPLAFQARRDGGPGGGFSAGASFGDQVPVRELAGREQTERTGAGVAHENMPPFVALFWCRKD